jgi:hypothetical protein
MILESKKDAHLNSSANSPGNKQIRTLEVDEASILKINAKRKSKVLQDDDKSIFSLHSLRS